MVVLPPESNVLAWHPVKGSGYVPCFVRVTGIFREVRCSRSRSRSVNRRKQNQVPPRIIDLSAADGQSVTVVVKPESVVKHVSQKTLFGALRGISGTANTTAMFTSHITGERESHLVQKIFGLVVVLDLNTVVRVIAYAARGVQRVLPQQVLIAENRQPSVRSIYNLHSKTRPVVESPVGLPAVHEPRFDFQMLGREDLHAHTIEKPWRVGRNIGRLVRPVVELVVAE